MLLTLEDPKTEQARRIVVEILPDVIDLFIRKNADYEVDGKNVSEKFGVKGQYMKLHDKVAKLYGPLWEGKSLEGEQAEEVLSDLIAHALLTLDFLVRDRINEKIQANDDARRAHLAKMSRAEIYEAPDQDQDSNDPIEPHYFQDGGLPAGPESLCLRCKTPYMHHRVLEPKTYFHAGTINEEQRQAILTYNLAMGQVIRDAQQ